MRGTKWSNETTLKAYKIQLACGSTGYDVVKELGQLLPSQRTLNEEVLNVMKTKVNMMVEEEIHCGILNDELAITPELDSI
jgi:hypothetical protein